MHLGGPAPVPPFLARRGYRPLPRPHDKAPALPPGVRPARPPPDFVGIAHPSTGLPEGILLRLAETRGWPMWRLDEELSLPEVFDEIDRLLYLHDVDSPPQAKKAD